MTNISGHQQKIIKIIHCKHSILKYDMREHVKIIENLQLGLAKVTITLYKFVMTKVNVIS